MKKPIIYIVLVVISIFLIWTIWFQLWRDGYYMIEYDNWDGRKRLSKTEIIYLLYSHPNLNEAFAEMRQLQIDTVKATQIDAVSDDDCPFTAWKLRYIHCWHR